MLQGSKLKNTSIKKTLLFHNSLIQEFNQNKPAQKSKNLTLSGRVLKKYRLIHKTKQFGLTYNSLRKTEKTPHLHSNNNPDGIILHK